MDTALFELQNPFAFCHLQMQKHTEVTISELIDPLDLRHILKEQL